MSVTDPQPPSEQPGQQQGSPLAPALAAVAATRLPPNPAPDALGDAEKAAILAALLAAIARWHGRRDRQLAAQLRTEPHARQPGVQDILNQLINRELGYEVAYRNKQRARVQAALQEALSVPSKAMRDEKVREVIKREKQIGEMRDKAMHDRIAGGVAAFLVERASPEGAYWRLSNRPGIKHCELCKRLAGRAYDWDTLHTIGVPPKHPRCECSLVELPLARKRGWLREGLTSARDAAQLLEEAKQHLHESPWLERYPKGFEFGGRFRPKVGGDAGAAILRKLKLERKGERRPEPERGHWTHIAGRSVFVPYHEWQQTIGGRIYRSPAGTIDVYEDGKLAARAPDHRELTRVAQLAARARRQRRAATLHRQGQPLRNGDTAAHIAAMPDRGYELLRTSPGAGGWRLHFRHRRTGASADAKLAKNGIVADASWDAAPIPERKPRKLDRPPRSWGEMQADAHAWAQTLGRRYGADVRLASVEEDATLADHAGTTGWAGDVRIGRDARPDIERAAQSRATGRALNDDQRRGVYSAYWTVAHELAHSVNPASPRDFRAEGANLEEALAEEMSHPLALERLSRSGQADVVRWAFENPDALAVVGNYLPQRGALADVLDRAGALPGPGRLKAIESLKFRTPPSERFRFLARMLHDAHPETSERDWERWARETLRNGSESRPALEMSPGWVKGWQRMLEDVTSPATVTRGKEGTYEQIRRENERVEIGGDVDEPAEQGLVPTFRHVRLALKGKAWGWGDSALDANDDGDGRWIVKGHGGSADRVASELLANAVYRELGVDAPVMGRVETPPVPDWSQVPDELSKEPKLPDTPRLSTGIILVEPHTGRITLVEPRGHYSGYQNTFPKGGVEPGLSAQQNAHKELQEETGLRGRILGVLGDYEGQTGATRYYVGVRTGGDAMPSDETQSVLTVTPLQAEEKLNVQRDRDVLRDLVKSAEYKKIKTAKGFSFKDVVPPARPGAALAFKPPAGKKEKPKGLSDALGEGFMADALVGNWRPVGSDGEGLRWQEQNPVRVNHDSTFEFAPSGSAKAFGDVPVEAGSLRYKGDALGVMNPSGEDLRRQAKAIAKKLTAPLVHALVEAAGFRDPLMAARVEHALNARVRWMRAFAAGKQQIPEPLEGVRARLSHKEAQGGFQVYPEEHEALEALTGGEGDALAERLKDGKAPTKDQERMAARLDKLLADATTGEDSYAYMALPKKPGEKFAGQTVRSKGYLVLTTDRDAAAAHAGKDGAVMRIVIPAGSHAFYLGSQPPGEPDLVAARDQRLMVTSAPEGEDPQAVLMPYQKPLSLYVKPWSTQKGWDGGPPGGRWLTGDRVRMPDGKEATVTLTPRGDGKLSVKVDGAKGEQIVAERKVKFLGGQGFKPGQADVWKPKSGKSYYDPTTGQLSDTPPWTPTKPKGIPGGFRRDEKVAVSIKGKDVPVTVIGHDGKGKVGVRSSVGGIYYFAPERLTRMMESPGATYPLPNYKAWSLEHLENRHSDLVYGRLKLPPAERRRHLDAIVKALHIKGEELEASVKEAQLRARADVDDIGFFVITTYGLQSGAQFSESGGDGRVVPPALSALPDGDSLAPDREVGRLLGAEGVAIEQGHETDAVALGLNGPDGEGIAARSEPSFSADGSQAGFSADRIQNDVVIGTERKGHAAAVSNVPSRLVVFGYAERAFPGDETGEPVTEGVVHEDQPTRTALLAVDVQPDFIDGSLGGATPEAVAERRSVIKPLLNYAKRVDLVVASRDWHPANHISFSSEPKFVDKSWPPHAVQGTPGAEIVAPIREVADAIATKGTDPAREAYSAFDGTVNGEPLEGYLRRQGIGRVVVGGLASDYCVRATALDAQRLGFDTRLATDAIAGVAPETTQAALDEMHAAGIKDVTRRGWSDAARERSLEVRRAKAALRRAEEAELFDPALHPRGVHGRFADKGDAIDRIKALGFEVTPPGEHSTMKPYELSEIAQGLEEAVHEYPILLNGPGKPITAIKFTSAPGVPSTPMALATTTGGEFGNAQPSTEIIFNDSNHFGMVPADYAAEHHEKVGTPSSHTFNTPASKSWYGVTWHEIGHALMNAAGVSGQNPSATAPWLARYGITFEDSKHLSKYAVASRAEGLGEMSAQFNTPTFKDDLEPGFKAKLAKMFADLKNWGDKPYVPSAEEWEKAKATLPHPASLGGGHGGGGGGTAGKPKAPNPQWVMPSAEKFEQILSSIAEDPGEPVTDKLAVSQLKLVPGDVFEGSTPGYRYLAIADPSEPSGLRYLPLGGPQPAEPFKFSPSSARRKVNRHFDLP